jgi:hypothetical protein
LICAGYGIAAIGGGAALGQTLVGPVLAAQRRRGLGVKGRLRPSDGQGAALDAGVAVPKLGGPKDNQGLTVFVRR